MRPRLRPSFSFAAAATFLLVARTAAAQFDGGTTVSTFAAEDFFIGVQHEAGANLSDFDILRFFNKARCDCDEPVFVYVALTNSGFAKRTSVDRSGNIEFWVGTDCANTSLREQRCLLLKGQTMQAFLNAGRDTVPTTARVLSTYTGGGGTIDAGVVSNFTPNPTCTLPLEQFSQTLYVLSNVTGTPQQLDVRSVLIDLTPPPSPDPLFTDVQGGEQAVTISWQGVDSAVITDLLGYQVLCDRGGDLQVFSDGTFKPGYLSCPATTSGMGVKGLDPRFICSPLLSATARSFRVKILQNDITYGAGVAAIDISGNASIPEIFYGTATKTRSFYDVYRNDDFAHQGAATGGFCTLGSGTTSRAALTGLGAALAIAVVVLARRRRRR